MKQKKLFFIVVVSGLLFSGFVSGRPGDGKWTLYGCCDIEAFHECWGPWTYSTKAACEQKGQEGIAQCRAGAAENKAHSMSITGGCTFDGNEDDERTKCLNSCATFYVCTWENGMCIKRINPEDDYINEDNPLHIDQPSTTTTLSKLRDNENNHPADALEQKHRCLNKCPKDFVCTYEPGSGCTQTPKPPDPLEQKRKCLDNCPADFVCSYESGNGCTQTPKPQTKQTETTTSTNPAKNHDIEKLANYTAYEQKSDYCGPNDYPKVVKFIPRGPPLSGVDFNQACYNHDKCYSQCSRTGNTKSQCDLEFGSDMVQKCQATIQPSEDACANHSWYNPLRYTCQIISKARKVYCYDSAGAYWLAVAGFANTFGAYPCN